MKKYFEMVENLFVASPAFRIAGFAISGLLTLVYAYFLSRSMSAFIDISEPVRLASYQQDGRMGYTVYLTPNNLYEEDQIVSDGTPGGVYFTRLVDSIRATYHYQFILDQEIQQAEFIYLVTGRFGVVDVWERDFILVPPTTVQETEFEIPFVIPVLEVLQWEDLFLAETGVKLSAPTFHLNIQVIPAVSTLYGEIGDPFEQEILMQVSASEIRFLEGGTHSQTGVLSAARTESEEDVRLIRSQRITSAIILVLSFLVFMFFVWLQVRLVNRKTQLERDFEYARKRLGGLFVRTRDITPIQESEEVIRLNSLKDLVNLADETLRPVLYTLDEKGRLRFVILRLGYVRYEYVTEKKAQEAAPAGRPQSAEERDESRQAGQSSRTDPFEFDVEESTLPQWPEHDGDAHGDGDQKA